MLKTFSKKYRIRVYRYENVGNHLHLLLKTEGKSQSGAKADFQNFLRRFAGAVAFQVTDAKKASPQGGFWEKLAYSRLITWGREYKAIHDYFTKNFFESKGLWAGASDSFLSPWLLSMIQAGVGPPTGI